MPAPETKIYAIVGGVKKDLNQIFKERGITAPRANTGIKANISGVPTDIAQLFYASTGVGDRASTTTGIKILDGSIKDLQELFRKIDYFVGPIINTQPSHTSPIIEGASINLSVVATAVSGGTLHYQWQFNSSNIVGATSNTYNIGTSTRTNDGAYKCIIDEKVGGVTVGSSTSDEVSIEIYYKPTITVQPPSTATYNEGDHPTISVTVTPGNPSTTIYQWRRAGVNINDSFEDGRFSNWDQATMDWIVDRNDNDGNFDCVISNAAGQVVSNGCDVTAQFAPEILSHPSSATVSEGEGVSFSVSAIGVPTPTYQWYKNGVAIGGATNDDYSIPSAAPSHDGTYTCVVSNGISPNATSLPATLNVIPDPYFTTQPSALYETHGTGPYYLTVAAAGGTGTLMFSWFQNGYLVAGPRTGNLSGTSDRLEFSPTIDYSDNGSYYCTVEDSLSNAGVSNVVNVTVPAVAPTINNINGVAPSGGWVYAGPFNPGDMMSYTVNYNPGAPSPSVVWHVWNWGSGSYQAVYGGSTYVVAAGSSGTHYYMVSVSNAGGTAMVEVQVTVN